MPVMQEKTVMPFHDSGKPAGASLARKVPAIRPAQKPGLVGGKGRILQVLKPR
jgi:hypothetical protein